MPMFKIVLERTDAVTYQAVVFADAADHCAANKAARALDEAGKLAWDAATSSRGDTAGVETTVATADERRAAVTQGLLDAHGATSDQVGAESSLCRAQRIIELLVAYGEAKFGNEWWPGNARPWLGAKKGAELEELLG